MPGSSIVDEILRHHGVPGRWSPLLATGIANHIYATDEIVLRIATDHEDAISDARTESVAAPVAHAAGITTPRLIAFDDSRALINRPYSLWERVRGETVGVFANNAHMVPETWRAVGRELARLHTTVCECPDPKGWLDAPGLGEPRAMLPELIAARGLDADTARLIEAWLERLEPAITVAAPPRFLHDDLHDNNLMCSRDDKLLALLDWGDAGWGDPALDFASMPLDAVELALAEYEAVAPGVLGDGWEARMLWARIEGALGRIEDDPRRTGKLRELLRLCDQPAERFRGWLR